MITKTTSFSSTSHQHPLSYAAFGLAAASPAQEPAAIFLGLGCICQHTSTLESTGGSRAQLVGAASHDCGHQLCGRHHSTGRKVSLGKEWEGTSCFHFRLLLARQGVGMAYSVFSRLNKMTACLGDGSHFSGQHGELAVLVVTLGARLDLQRGSRSICVIPK